VSVLATASVVSGLAIAGSTSFSQVSFPSATQVKASLIGARSSADTVQLVMCNTYAYDSGNAYGSCFAKNAAGATKQCFAANAEQLAVMQSVGPASYIAFTIAADGNTCQQVSVTNGSSYVSY
jgi:hypothetical protein